MWKWFTIVVGRAWKNFEEHDRKSLDFLEYTLSRNIDIKDSANESSEGSEEHGRENLCCLGEYLNNY